MTKFSNLIQSIPNDDDLDDVYHWERKDFNEATAVAHKLSLKTVKQSLVLPCVWRGEVRVKSSGGEWCLAFLLCQGRRLVWWTQESDFDEGKPASGQLLFFGHCGVTQPSPIDVRESGGDGTRLLCTFGRSIRSLPLKLTVLCKDSVSCEALSREIGTITKDLQD